MFYRKRQQPFFAIPWRRALLGVLIVVVGLTGAINAARPPAAQAATSSYLNFQARLMTSAGGIVPDGYYNAQFKLYDAVTGGTNLWTESYYDNNGVTAGNDNRLQVVNGYLTANLGSQTAFPSINWDQPLWITLNIGGVTQTATPTYDGEMNPRLQLTAVPYAFRAGQLAKTTGANVSTLDFATQTLARSLLLPDESGTLCIRGSTACGFASTTGSGSYIQNGTSTQTANFNIQSAASGSVGGVIRGAFSQSADLLQFQDSSGAVLSHFDSGGKLALGTTAAPTSVLTIGTNTTTAAGGITFGTDTNLYRSAADTLKTDDALIVTGATTLQSTLGVTGAITGSSTITGTTLNGTTGINTGPGAGTQRIDASGNLTNIGTITSGLINGQTISNAANFTGTLGVAGVTTLAGDLNVNGNTTIGNATSDRLTLTSQILGGVPLVFQGATDNSFTTSFSITDPTANQTVTFRDGSGTVCLENSVNCGFAASSGSGSYIQNGTSPQTADFNITGNGVVGGNFTNNGVALFKNTTNSTTAFRIQNSAGTTTLFNADTTNNRVGIGTATPISLLDVTGPTPAITLKNSFITNQVWQFRNGGLGVGSTAFDIFDQSNNQSRFAIQNDGDVLIGATANPANNSRLYVFGGSHGANIDARGDGAVSDQATIELEGSDYDTLPNSVLLQYFGPNGIGTTLGFNNQKLGLLAFNATDTAIIKTSNATPLIFGTNDTERARLDGNGNLGIGITPTASAGLLQLASGTTAASGIAFGTDTNLYRSAANTLKTDDALVVTGAITSGLINGQTISSTANFTGTVGVATALTTPILQSAAATTLLVDSGTTGALNIGTGANAKTITLGNVTGATGLIFNAGTNGFKFNETTGTGISVTSNAVVPTVDQLAITNTSSTGVTTAGVNGLSIAYKGGAAAVEAAAARIDLQPGTTSGGTWSGFRLVPNATGAVLGVTENALKIDSLTTPGAGTENAISVGTGWDSILSYNGNQIISGTGILQSGALNGTYGNLTGTGALTAGSIASGFGTITTANTIQGTQFISTVATGTAPLTVASTTKVTNLNADLLDGLDSTAFAAASGSANYIQNGSSPQTANFNITGNGVTGGTLTAAGILNANATGKTAITIADSGAQLSGITIGGDTNLYRSTANTLKTDDNFLIQTTTNSTTAFQIQNTAGTSNLLVADTTNTRLGVGAAPATSLLTIGTNTSTAAGGLTFGSDVSLYRYGFGSLRTDGGFYVGDTIVGSSTLYSNSGTSGQIALANNAGAPTIYFGSALDTNLYRDAAGNALKTDDSLIVGGTTTLQGNLTLGTASATPVLLLLGIKNTAGDPTCTNGAIYYNSSTSQSKVCINSGWTAVGVPRVTSLPSSPSDGDEVYYVADATNSILWHLRYNSSWAGTAKWEYVGGTSLYNEQATANTIGVGIFTYVALGSAGPVLTVPLAGDYDVALGANFYAGASTFPLVSYMSYDIGVTPAVDADAANSVSWGATGSGNSLSREKRKTFATGGTTLTAKYKQNNNNAQFANRWMRLTPVRVGP